MDLFLWKIWYNSVKFDEGGKIIWKSDNKHMNVLSFSYEQAEKFIKKQQQSIHVGYIEKLDRVNFITSEVCNHISKNLDQQYQNYLNQITNNQFESIVEANNGSFKMSNVIIGKKEFNTLNAE